MVEINISKTNLFSPKNPHNVIYQILMDWQKVMSCVMLTWHYNYGYKLVVFELHTSCSYIIVI
jgi:hypothetical protein